MTDLTGWTNVSERVYVWNYATNFEEFVAPFPNYRTIEASDPAKLRLFFLPFVELKRGSLFVALASAATVWQANIKLFGQLGVKGLFEEAAYGGPGGDLSELKSFLMSSLMW